MILLFSIKYKERKDPKTTQQQQNNKKSIWIVRSIKLKTDFRINKNTNSTGLSKQNKKNNKEKILQCQ